MSIRAECDKQRGIAGLKTERTIKNEQPRDMDNIVQKTQIEDKQNINRENYKYEPHMSHQTETQGEAKWSSR